MCCGCAPTHRKRKRKVRLEDFQRLLVVEREGEHDYLDSESRNDLYLRCVLLDEFSREAEKQFPGRYVFDDALLATIDNATNNIPGTAFRCDMLAGCSCEEPCDWKLAFETPHCFPPEARSKESLLAFDPSRGYTAEGVHCGTLIHFRYIPIICLCM